MSDKKKKSFWFYFTEGAKFLGATVLTFAPEILGQFPGHTVASKLAIPVTVIWTGLRMRDWYMKDILPDAATNILDRMPDKVTGVKGSKLPSGLSNNNPG